MNNTKDLKIFSSRSKQEDFQKSKKKLDEEHKKIESMQALIEQINKDREVLKIRVEGLVKTKSKVGIIKLCFYLFY